MLARRISISVPEPKQRAIETATIETAKDDPQTLGCKSLFYAVIDRALRDAGNPRWDINKEDKRSAIRWIKSDAYNSHSFLWACEVVGIRPESIRNLLSHTSSLAVYVQARSRVGRGPLD